MQALAYRKRLGDHGKGRALVAADDRQACEKQRVRVERHVCRSSCRGMAIA